MGSFLLNLENDTLKTMLRSQSRLEQFYVQHLLVQTVRKRSICLKMNNADHELVPIHYIM